MNQKICFRLKVRQEKLDEYITRHANVWPEMLRALHATGWRNYSLFLDKDGTLIGYFETASLEASLQGMAKTEVNSRWQKEMADFFELAEGQVPDSAFVQLTQIFNLEDQLERVS